MTQADSSSYLAAVVQTRIRAVTDDVTAAETMAANARHVARAIDAVQALSDEPVRLLVFTGQFLTGHRRKDRGVSLEAVAVDLEALPAVLDPVLDACRRHGCYVASATQERMTRFPGRYFHTAFVLGPEGLVLRSPKAQAFSAPGVTALREVYDDYVAAYGQEAVLPVVETPLGRLGCLVEGEALVPETVRLLASKGADLVLFPGGERPTPGHPPYDALRRSVAYTNGVYWLSANRSRETPGLDGPQTEWFHSTSAIVAPTGELVASLDGRCDGFAAARIDLAGLREVRQRQQRDTTPVADLYRHLYQA